MVWRKTNPLAEHLIEIGTVIRQFGQSDRDTGWDDRNRDTQRRRSP
jgi:hypothetical protein